MGVQLIFKGGGSFVLQQPQFSLDNEIIYVQWKNIIFGYNTKTGKLVSELKGFTSNIFGFTVHNYNSFECITACSKSGEIITWKTDTYLKIVNEKLCFDNIKTFHVISSGSLNEIKALISYETAEGVCFMLLDILNESIDTYEFSITPGKFFLDVSSNNYFAVAQENNLYFVKFNNFKQINYGCIQKKQFTCIACHKKDEIVLSGDNLGRVIVWQNLFTKSSIQRVFHWHTLPVKSVCFSTEGSYFYSGGSENVLVKWHFENESEKKFLPRLSANIKKIAIATNNLLIAIATNDNAVKILDSNFQPISLIQHLIIDKEFKSGIILDPRTKALVMNGTTGHVQFYTPNDKELLYNVDVVGQNKITNERNCQIENTQVTKIAISKSGYWMASVEEREDLDYSNEIRLKFLMFDVKNQIFELNTSIESPHDSRINSILFQPSNNDEDLKCITVGDDSKFKVWQLIDATTIYTKNFAWKCFGIGFYRNLPCNSLSLSMDGSLMAIGFGPILTTWLPDTIELKCSLHHSEFKENIKFVEFGRNKECHLVVTASEFEVNVWNLLTLCITWTVPLQVSILIADSISTNMAVITKDNSVFVFSPGSPKPIFSITNLKKILTASFVPTKNCNDTRLSWYQRSPIYFIDSYKELFCIGVDEEFVETYQEIEETTSNSLFSMMKPQQSNVNLAKTDESSSSSSQHLFRKDEGLNSFKKYFETPLHTMMPIRFTCGSLLRSLVVQKNNNVAT